jgi:uncharacterized membrane protein YfcA
VDIYAIVLLLLGFTAGTLNSSIGLGWGVINIPVLMMLPTLSARQAVALSIVTGIFANGAATFENSRHGLVQWHYAFMMGLGGIGGGILGSYFLRNIPALTLRRIIGALVIVFGARMVMGK